MAADHAAGIPIYPITLRPDFLQADAMEHEKLRRRICFEAAQLLHSRRETNFTTARWRAARSITRSYLDSDFLPTDMEIRMALQELVATSAASVSTPTSDGMSLDEASDSRFLQYHALLEPMDRVRMNRREHPEGDLLYHSLQVFHLAYDARPWDEDFLLAALLHDVGYGIDPHDADLATVTAIQDIVSERTLWLVENLPTQHRIAEGTIGARARRRLDQHEDNEELRLLAVCDINGRLPGRKVDELQAVIQTIKDLSRE